MSDSQFYQNEAHKLRDAQKVPLTLVQWLFIFAVMFVTVGFVGLLMAKAFQEPTHARVAIHEPPHLASAIQPQAIEDYDWSGVYGGGIDGLPVINNQYGFDYTILLTEPGIYAAQQAVDDAGRSGKYVYALFDMPRAVHWCRDLIMRNGSENKVQLSGLKVDRSETTDCQPPASMRPPLGNFRPGNYYGATDAEAAASGSTR